jgi:hypothetical protein
MIVKKLKTLFASCLIASSIVTFGSLQSSQSKLNIVKTYAKDSWSIIKSHPYLLGSWAFFSGLGCVGMYAWYKHNAKHYIYLKNILRELKKQQKGKIPVASLKKYGKPEDLLKAFEQDGNKVRVQGLRLDDSIEEYNQLVVNQDEQAAAKRANLIERIKPFIYSQQHKKKRKALKKSAIKQAAMIPVGLGMVVTSTAFVLPYVKSLIKKGAEYIVRKF